MKWFVHGKWPKFLVNLHLYTIISFCLLLITGVMLYLPAWHTALIPYLALLHKIHIYLGLIFAISLLTPLLRLLPKGKTIWKFDWLMPMLFGAAIVITGLLLWGVTVFPTVWRSPAFTWHGVLSVILSFWLLIHVFMKAFGLRFERTGFAGRVDPNRRRFLTWLGSGFAGAAVLSVFPSIGLRAAVGSGGKKGLATGYFAEYYTVVDGFPTMNLHDYRLVVDGLVDKPVTWTFGDLMKVRQSNETVDFHCVTGWSVPNVRWEGIHIRELVNEVHPHAEVKYVHFYSFDGVYTESLPISEALDDTVMLAWRLDGEALKQSQGYPLRLVVPKQYGYKSIKWVSRVEFSDKPLLGYWEQRGYPSEAQI